MASARSRTRSRFSKTEGVAVSRIPAWSVTPVFPSLTPGVAASYVLPVSAQGDVITVTWGGPTTKPAWVSFSPPNALPMIYFSGGQTNTVAGVTLIATANGSSVPSASADISVVVVNPAPSWSAAPSFSGLTQGVTSVQALPVTVSNGAVITPTWVGPGTIGGGGTYPWISLQGGTTPTITFTNPPVATISNVVISALANGQTTLSSTVGTGSVTVSAAGGSDWITIPTVYFAAGTSGVHLLRQYVPISYAGMSLILLGTLPSGVTFVDTLDAEALSYDGIGPSAAVSGLQLFVIPE